MKWTLLILLLLLLPVANAVNYPQPRGFVTDNANIIDSQYEAKITQLAQKIEKENTVEIAVVTVDSLEGESIEMYAVNLFERAGIGKKDKDNGLLILVVCCEKEDRGYRFEVGYGLEGTITDSMKVNIGDRIIVPNFRNGDYGKGIYESMVVIQGLVKGNEEVKSQYSMPQTGGQGEPVDWEVVIFIVIILIIILMSASGKMQGGTYGGGYS
ncbi:MAG: TPM domain-containing protein, partial [Candidatus Methanoperedens sp.]